VHQPIYFCINSLATTANTCGRNQTITLPSCLNSYVYAIISVLHRALRRRTGKGRPLLLWPCPRWLLNLSTAPLCPSASAGSASALPVCIRTTLPDSGSLPSAAVFPERGKQSARQRWSSPVAGRTPLAEDTRSAKTLVCRATALGASPRSAKVTFCRAVALGKPSRSAND
jgi:hypothetical protein